MKSSDIKDLQRRMNRFVQLYLRGLGPILVDGKMGPSTEGRIRTIKWYLGYTVPKGSKGGSNSLSADPDKDFRQRLWHPRRRKYSTATRIARGAARRIAQRHRARKNKRKAHATSGVGTYDGRPVANWMVPYLQWAREHGWRGTLVSGWRDPNYSKSLCYRMCGAPSCPGRCAGLSSNHVGSVKPRGAIDVTDYQRFGQLMRQCPHQPHIFNALGARDPVHFSASGN